MWREDLNEYPAELYISSEFSYGPLEKIGSLYTKILDLPHSKFLVALIAFTIILLLIRASALRRRHRKAFLYLLKEGMEGHNKANERSENMDTLLANASSTNILNLVK